MLTSDSKGLASRVAEATLVLPSNPTLAKACRGSAKACAGCIRLTAKKRTRLRSLTAHCGVLPEGTAAHRVLRLSSITEEATALIAGAPLIRTKHLLEVTIFKNDYGFSKSIDISK